MEDFFGMVVNVILDISVASLGLLIVVVAIQSLFWVAEVASIKRNAFTAGRQIRKMSRQSPPATGNNPSSLIVD